MFQSVADFLVMGQAPSSSSKKQVNSFTSRSMSFRPTGSLGRRKQQKIGTLRKKIAKTLKGGRNPDYKRHMRELLEEWDLKDVRRLVEEYEALNALKEVTVNSELARESVSNLRADLCKLYDDKHLTDMIIEYKGSQFQVHRPILVSRCPLFDKKLSGLSDLRKPVNIDLEVNGITTELFPLLLKYLYTGEILSNNIDCEEVFRKLGEKFGMPNVLEKDLKSLLESEQLADVKVVVNAGGSSTGSRQSETNVLGFKCHSAILCARSLYFKSLITRKVKEDCGCLGVNTPLTIVIDENVLPRQYIRVLLQCMYLDCVDLRSIIKWKSASDDSNGSTAETDKLLTTSEIAMELYEIGKFLDFPTLCQACEDIIIEDISSSSLVGVLEWSWQPYGSKWVHRQAMRYLREDFVTVCKSSSFIANLPKKFLIDALSSDFLHASEEEVISAVIRWGEWQVSKALDKQSGLAPNSLNRRSPKRKDISDTDLCESLKDILQYVRKKHVLPKNSVVLQTAYHRGLFHKPAPPDVGLGEKDLFVSSEWVKIPNERNKRIYTRPRFFLPYFEESKAILNERILADSASENLRGTRFATMPDMVPGMEIHESDTAISEQTLERYKTYSADVVNIERKTIKAMGRRERELKRMNTTQKAFNLLSGEYSLLVNTEIQKRVMREFGYPDSFACEVFRQAPDLIEDSSSSSGSSRQSTLSKVGEISSELAVSAAAAPDVTLAAGEIPYSLSTSE